MVEQQGQLALDLAKDGNPCALIVRLMDFLRCGQWEALTDGEIEWITETLVATASKDVKDGLRSAERQVVAMQVEHLKRADESKMEAVVDVVVRQTGRSPRYVYQAIVENREKTSSIKIGLAALDRRMSRHDVTKAFEYRNRKNRRCRRKEQE